MRITAGSQTAMLNRLLALCSRTEGHAAQYRLLAQQATIFSEWDNLPEEAEHHGLAPLAYRHLDAAEISLPASTRRALHALTLRHRQANQIRLQALAEILNAYRDAGLDALVLKGAALAHTVYPNLELRPMRDIDLLVRPEQALRAQAILSELGFDAPVTLPPHLPADHYHLAPAARQSEGLIVSVEIHHHLFRLSQNAPRLSFESLFDKAIPFLVGGTTAYTLNHAEMLWHIYRHAFGIPQMFEPFRLIYVADLVSLIEKYWAQMDWEQIKQFYPQVWNIFPLLHGLTPWSETILQQFALPIESAPPGAGMEFQGWPRIQVVQQRQQGKTIMTILRDTFFPAAWWLRMYYGIGGSGDYLWHRCIRHPLHITGWLLRYCQERFGKK